MESRWRPQAYPHDIAFCGRLCTGLSTLPTGWFTHTRADGTRRQPLPRDPRSRRKRQEGLPTRALRAPPHPRGWPLPEAVYRTSSWRGTVGPTNPRVRQSPGLPSPQPPLNPPPPASAAAGAGPGPRLVPAPASSQRPSLPRTLRGIMTRPPPEAGGSQSPDLWAVPARAAGLPRRCGHKTIRRNAGSPPPPRRSALAPGP